MDVIDLTDFYASDLGVIVRRLLARTLRKRWPTLTGHDCIGIGYAMPFLDAWRIEAAFAAGFVPARLGISRWPKGGPGAAALIDEVELPLGDGSVDRVLIVHGLEISDAPDQMLEEVWRVLKSGGRVLLVVPNRRGLWARVDATPFGHGRPFSRGQMLRLLRDAGFDPEHWASALFMPPSSRGFVRRSAIALERLGARLWAGFSGVLVVEATKQIYGAIDARAQRRELRRLRPILAPQGAPQGASFKPARQARDAAANALIKTPPARQKC